MLNSSAASLCGYLAPVMRAVGIRMWGMMTLLIGTVSNTNIVITADGLSRANPLTEAGIRSNAFQKIFPLPSISIAIAHHGFNILAGDPVNEFLQQFMTNVEKDFTAFGVHEITIELHKFTDSAAKAIFANPTNKGIIGFWVAGFSSEELRPLLYEIWWKPNKHCTEKHDLIVFGGDGKEFVRHHIEEFEKDRSKCEEVSRYSLEDALKFHSKIYEEAEEKQKQGGEKIFGGHQHQLVIKKDGWHWIKPPQALKGID